MRSLLGDKHSQPIFRLPWLHRRARRRRTFRWLRPITGSGFYIGGNLGAGFSKNCIFGSDWQHGFDSSNSNTSFLGGGQVGVNYEFGGGVVVGAEAMFDWLPNTNNTINATGAGAATGSTAAATINNRWLTTATGKLGYAWDRVLLYGKGGGLGRHQQSIVTVTGAPASFSTNSTNNCGWTAGLGVEWAFAGNWSARAE